MNILHYDHLLNAARQQPEPQRLLFVFAQVELPDDASPEERERFEAGEGGALVPRLCVAKTPDEETTFTALCEQADGMDCQWSLVVSAAVGGQRGQPPTEQAVDQALEQLVGRVQAGALDGLLVFDRKGEALSLSA
jgi:hypothetical protein